jgi:hypothetical protein
MNNRFHEVMTLEFIERFEDSFQFRNFSVSHDSLALSAATIQESVEAQFPSAQVNRTTLPAPINPYNNIVYGYNLNEISTDPQLIRAIQEYEFNYNLLQIEANKHAKQSADIAHRWVLYRWCEDYFTVATPAVNPERPNDPAYVLPTATPLSGLTQIWGTTGAFVNIPVPRLLLTLEDILAAKRHFDENNYPATGRYVVMNQRMYNDLLTIAQVGSSDFVTFRPTEDGVVGELFGFTILEPRAWTPKFIIAASGGGFNPANALVTVPATRLQQPTGIERFSCIFFHADSVASAVAGYDVLVQDDPSSYRRVMSTIVHVGASRRRQTGVFVVAESFN